MAPYVRPAVHPLLIDHVIGRIIEERLLKPKDLQNIRAVCKQWNTQATKELSKRTGLNLCLGYKKEISLMHELIAMIEDPNGNFPLPNYIKFNSANYCNEPDIFKFLTMFAGSVTDLEDKSCRFNILEQFNELRFPKLKRFEVVVRNPWITMLPQNPSQILAHRILRGSPILEEVSISWALARIPKNKEFVAIELDLLRSIPLNVKKLSISKALRPNTAQLLSSSQWSQLTCLILDFRFGRSPLTAKQFCGLFENCSNTLTELSVTRYEHAVKLPVFPRVTKLTLGITDVLEDTPADHELNNFTYHFPAVQTLDILSLSSHTVLNALFPLYSTAPEVRNCKLPYVQMDNTSCVSLSRIFRSVKTLHLTPVPYREYQMLMTVFLYMKDVEHLHLNFVTAHEFGQTDYPVNLDQIFTGNTETVCAVMRKEKTYGPELKCELGFTDLRKLKSLYIRAINPFQMPITDVTGYLAFLEMENLEVLQIDNFRLSTTCLNALKSRFGSLKHTQGRQEFKGIMEALPEIRTFLQADLLALPIPLPEQI